MTSGDCNNITAPGVYDLKREVLNQPFLYTTVVVYKRGNTIHQVGYDADNCQSAYRLFDGTTWKSWARTDNFGCNTPADLASLLGVKQIVNTNIDSNGSITIPIATMGCIIAINSDGSAYPAIALVSYNSVSNNIKIISESGKYETAPSGQVERIILTRDANNLIISSTFTSSLSLKYQILCMFN